MQMSDREVKADKHVATSDEWDPVYLSGRREAIVVLLVFFAFSAYVLPVCYLMGSTPTEGETPPLSMIAGLPAWVVWGILLPWIAANVVTAWFCFFYMKNEPLSSESEPQIPTQATSGTEQQP
jgi:fatty acid desaturase